MSFERRIVLRSFGCTMTASGERCSFSRSADSTYSVGVRFSALARRDLTQEGRAYGRLRKRRAVPAGGRPAGRPYTIINACAGARSAPLQT